MIPVLASSLSSFKALIAASNTLALALVILLFKLSEFSMISKSFNKSCRS